MGTTTLVFLIFLVIVVVVSCAIAVFSMLSSNATIDRVSKIEEEVHHLKRML